MRTNGFQAPCNAMQITTWVLIPLLLLHYSICITPVLPLVISLPLTILYFLTSCAATFYGYITTKTDSIDHLLYQHLHGSPHPRAVLSTAPPSPAEETASNATPQTPEETKYCWVCQTNVYAQSMHCKYCDKCVSVFDHHCMWLNTCIGSANYRYFYRTVLLSFTFVTIHVISLIVHLCLYFLDDAKVRTMTSDWWVGPGIVLIGINIGFLIFTASASFLLLQLFIFHVGLKREGITTYQYICRDSARKREKNLLANKIRQRRVEELEQAGNSMDAIILKFGSVKICQKCDPVRKLVLQEMENAEHNERCGNSREQGGDDDDDDDVDVESVVRERVNVGNGISNDDDDDEESDGDGDNIHNGSANGGVGK